MQSKSDQVQAHLFIMGRLTSGMLRADPDAPESPQGRTNRGVVIGILVAVLLCAGFFVFGLIKPGTKGSWREAGTLVVNKDTGARYLYLDGRLRPVRNYTSARLLLGKDMKVMTIGGASLKGTPHGAPVGIEGAPDDPPAGDSLHNAPWSVCSGSATGSTATTLAVATDAGGPGLEKDQALIATGPDKGTYLVWQGRKFLLDTQAHAVEALGYASDTPVPVSAAFLNALPSGPDLAPPAVPGRGAAGPELGGRPTRVGEIFKVTASGADARYYLLGRQGLTQVTATGAALVLADEATRKDAYAGGTAVARDLGSNALSGHLAPQPGLSAVAKEQPAAPPRPVAVEQGRTPCAEVESVADGTRVTVSLARQSRLGPVAQAPLEGLVAACTTVNRITVPAGGGALVHALGAGGGDVGDTLYLVTDTGVKYRLPAADSLTALGYTGERAQGLPSSLLSMLPTGPDLTPAAATAARSRSTAPPCESTARAPGSGSGGEEGRERQDAKGGEKRAEGQTEAVNLRMIAPG